MNQIDLSNKTILVTGGCGFIGSNFIELVLRECQNVKIYNIDMMDVGSREFTPDIGYGNTYIHIEDDINNIDEIQYCCVLPDEVDFIFHFAAQSHVDRSINDPTYFIQNNVLGITALLEWMRKYQPQARMINVSTDEVYGALGLDDEPFTENTNLDPRSPYSASKASADLVANSYFNTYKLDIVTTRCCNNFGPNQYMEKLIPTIIRNLKNGNKIPIYGTGENIREWIHVDDHNRSILEITNIAGSGYVYNVHGGTELTNLELVKIIINIVFPEGEVIEDYSKYIEFVQDRKGHDFRYAIASNRYYRDFELQDFYTALESTVKSYL